MQFGALAPDMNPRLNDGLLRVADGVYPTADGYRPVGQWVQVIAALPAAPVGGATFVSPAGETIIIAGTATNLYTGAVLGWSSIASGFTATRWRFAQFGGLGIATNANDVMQKIDLTTLTVSALGGTPPRFEALAVVGKGFLVGTVMNGDVLTLAWCAAFNAELWDFGYDQSDYQTLPTGGRINGIFSGEAGLILQRDRLVAMDYVGGNQVFDFREVSSNVGCVSVHSVAQWGNLGFFLSDEGFMQWDGGLTAIGDEIIDREFRAAYDSGDWASMSSAIDPVQSVVMWSMGNKFYCYDWTLKKWSTITHSAPIIFAGATGGMSVDEDEAVTGDTDTDFAGLASFDDARFQGGDPRLYVFKTDFTLGAFTGTPMAATFTGNDLELFTGRRANIRAVRPEIDAASGMTVTLATRQTLAGSATNYSTTTLQASGDMPIRASGRYLRPTVALAAGTAWSHARGLEFMGAPGGGR